MGKDKSGSQVCEEKMIVLDSYCVGGSVGDGRTSKLIAIDRDADCWSLTAVTFKLSRERPRKKTSDGCKEKM